MLDVADRVSQVMAIDPSAPLFEAQGVWRSWGDVAELGREVLISADFARYRPAGLTPLGNFALKGFAQRSEAFGLSEEEVEPIP